MSAVAAGAAANCQCAYPCSPGEFPCPLGKKCNSQMFCVNDPCYGMNCPAVNGNGPTCIDNGNNTGTCVDICAATCDANNICARTA